MSAKSFANYADQKVFYPHLHIRSTPVIDVIISKQMYLNIKFSHADKADDSNK